MHKFIINILSHIDLLKDEEERDHGRRQFSRRKIESNWDRYEEQDQGTLTKKTDVRLLNMIQLQALAKKLSLPCVCVY